jgi:hypothetical protein
MVDNETLFKTGINKKYSAPHILTLSPKWAKTLLKALDDFPHSTLPLMFQKAFSFCFTLLENKLECLTLGSPIKGAFIFSALGRKDL